MGTVLFLLATGSPAGRASQASRAESAGQYFTIQVLDRQTGRGVPLVELRTTNSIRLFTDSNGIVAFLEPGLMDREVFFFVESHGYEVPADGFGYRGVRLRTTPGHEAIIKIDRLNIAERLYRVTGQGIYRDSVLLGRPVPLKNPVLNGQVMGQDSVFTCLYRGRIFWMWGDTGKPSYPLGNFAMSGALSDLPPPRDMERGTVARLGVSRASRPRVPRASGPRLEGETPSTRAGKMPATPRASQPQPLVDPGASPHPPDLDPAVGVDLEYFVGADGFSRKMAPLKEPGMIWLDGLLTVPDPQGHERMVAKFARLRTLTEVLERGLMVFNDATNTFEPLVRPGLEFLPYRNMGHAFPVQVQGQPYYYFTAPSPMGARMRVPARWEAVIDANQYEVLTALAPEDRGRKTEDRGQRPGYRSPPSSVVRPPSYGPRWAAFGDVLAALGTGKTAVIEALEAEAKDLRVYDVTSGREIIPHNGTVYFNAHRQRWIGIFTQLYGVSSALGEIWYAEADTPVGPWAYARKVLTHHKYSFYNPKHHPLFDQDGGRTIYFEGTYTWTFSGSEERATPRYDYNQIMYRLNLDDPRLVLPVPVYQVRDGQNGRAYLLGDAARETRGWGEVESVAFFAMEPGRGNDQRIAVYADRRPDGHLRLTAKALGESAKPLFHALPAAGPTSANESIVPLYEYHHADSGAYLYSTDSRLGQEGWQRAQSPLCRVWRTPAGLLLLDNEARPDVF